MKNIVNVLGKVSRRASWRKWLAALALGTAATLAHADLSPPGANDWNCRPSAAHPNPVILVHGLFANMAENWFTLSPQLKSAGYCVFALNYGANAASQAMFGQVNGLGPIEQSADELGAFVQQVRTATGAAKVDIVGHSLGGMMPRYYLQFLGGANYVNALVQIAADNKGTTLHGVNKLAAAFPLVAQAVAGSWCQSCLQSLNDASFIINLNASGQTVPGVKYTVIVTKYDDVVVPYTSQFLPAGPNVKNILIQDQCLFDFSNHIAMAVDPIVARHVKNALDPAHATTPGCFG